MIYRVQQDCTYLMHEVPAIESMNKLGDQYGTFAFNPDPIAYSDVWKPLEIDFVNCDESAGVSEMPDISENFGRLFLSINAYSALKDVIGGCGEFLPVTYKGRDGYLFNPLVTAEVLEAVDPKLLVYDKHDNLIHYGFFEDRLSHCPLLKTDLDSCTRLFCTEVFKDSIERAGLKGVVFNSDIANPDGKAYGITH